MDRHQTDAAEQTPLRRTLAPHRSTPAYSVNSVSRPGTISQLIIRCALRAWPIFMRRINLFLPVQSHLQKYFRSHPTQITSLVPPSHPTEGRIAVVTDAGWDAVDAAAFCTRRDGRAGFPSAITGVLTRDAGSRTG